MADSPLDEAQRGGTDFAAIYEEHFDLLMSIAIGRFGIPEGDAETLAHDVFLSFLMHAHRVIDRERWLVGAICNASRNHLRQGGRTERLDDAAADAADPRSCRVVDMLPDQLAARQVYDCLTPKCQQVLAMRYMEGYTVPEIAAVLGTTKKYAQKLIGRCLEQAQRRSKVRERS